jgi:translation initiation factor 3 subunit I
MTFLFRPARWVALSEGCRDFLVARDNFKEHACAVSLYKLDLEAAATQWPSTEGSDEAAYLTIHVHEDPRQRVAAALWLPLNTHILVALANGTIKVFDAETGSCSREVDAHPGHNITSLTFSDDKTTFLTTSNDQTAKLWDTKDLQVVKTYPCNTTVNAAHMHPDRELVLMGGGQEARDVTTTAAGAGKFETRIIHAVHCNELGKVQGHFGPLNTCAWNPSGTSFVTGGEDGYARLHNMKEDWAAWEHLGEEPELTDPAVAKAVLEGLDLQEEEEAGSAASAGAGDEEQ